MTDRCSTVKAIRKECVRTKVDFPVILGELVCTIDQSWFGLVSKHSGDYVELIPLDLPQKLKYGAELRFLGTRTMPACSPPQYGIVIDPLGRKLGSFSPRRPVSEQPARKRSFWGLGKLEEFVKLQEGSGTVLVGDLSRGFSSLCARLAASQGADVFLAVCQGGLRELQMFCRAMELAGTSRSVLIWSAPWMTPALRAVVPECLMALIRSANASKTLVVVDDLRLWLNGLLELGEASSEPLLPNGYPHMTRQLFSQLLALPRKPGVDGYSISFVAGWSLDEEYPYISEHPYGFQLLRFMETGIILKEESERVIPLLDSWGDLMPLGQAWQALLDTASSCYDEEEQEALKDLIEVVQELYFESPLWEAFPPAPSLLFSEEDRRSIVDLVARPLAPLQKELLQLRRAIRLCSSEGLDGQRNCFIQWLKDHSRKGEGRE